MKPLVIIGGGIVGLAVANEILQRNPRLPVVLLEKEPDVALHQSGRNSGVIHSGIYYKPGTLKARLAREGNRMMVEFCRRWEIPHRVCGKLIAAVDEEELPGLSDLARRGEANRIEVRSLNGSEARQYEPNVSCLSALWVPSVGVVDYRDVCHRLSELIVSRGGEVRTGVRADRIVARAGSDVVESTAGPIETSFAINCAGLYSDRVARRSGVDPQVRIVPFRGEYWELRPERAALIRGLIYPVPDPQFPFLGVHLTRTADGRVHAGPNAVLAFKREGYRKTSISARDLFEVLTYPSFWRMAGKNLGSGMKEMWRSASKAAFAHSLQRLVPEIRMSDLYKPDSGVRAQSLGSGGRLVDDFLLIRAPRSLHVCNAPSPAATASLAIAKEIVDQLPSDLGLT